MQNRVTLEPFSLVVSDFIYSILVCSEWIFSLDIFTLTDSWSHASELLWVFVSNIQHTSWLSAFSAMVMPSNHLLVITFT